MQLVVCSLGNDLRKLVWIDQVRLASVSGAAANHLHVFSVSNDVWPAAALGRVLVDPIK